MGYWQNDNNRWWENDPNLSTCYTLLALEYALLGNDLSRILDAGGEIEIKTLNEE